MNLLLDTDVLIYFLRGDKRIRDFLLQNGTFYYSYITRKELLKKPGLTERERLTVLSLLSRLRQVAIDGKVATLAEELLKQHRKHGLQIPDALIASTAVVKNLTLVTFNQKHFKKIKALTLLPLQKIS